MPRNFVNREKTANLERLLDLMTFVLQEGIHESMRVVKFLVFLNCTFAVMSAFMLLSTIRYNFWDVERDLRQIPSTPKTLTTFSPDPARFINERLSCYNRDTSARTSYRGKYLVYYNFVRAVQGYQCNDTVTYATHGDVNYMQHLEPLLMRWQGPISIATYALKSDFVDTINGILYYRHCGQTDLVKRLATFHVFYHQEMAPSKQQMEWARAQIHADKANCSQLETFILRKRHTNTFRQYHGLLYPINLARNVAIETANTYFVFPCDIEMYPNPGFIDQFLDMVKRNPGKIGDPRTKVFVLAAFEMKMGPRMPDRKGHLVDMFYQGLMGWFHGLVCPRCHLVPFWKRWLQFQKDSTDMDIFMSEKRRVPYEDDWEPFFISTHDLPQFDERLSWDGMKDKMTLAYQLCLLDWDFLVLSNAFLVHRPDGTIKIRNNYMDGREEKTAKQNAFIERFVEPEFHTLYGLDEGCKRKEHQVNWTQVHSWEEQFLRLWGMNITLNET